MYERILLAYDGSVEGGIALREGALLAKWCDAKVFLLSVLAETAGLRVAEGTRAGAVDRHLDFHKASLARGCARLRQIGLNPRVKLVIGEPVREIGAFAREVAADLVVVGHRHQSIFSRWWSGETRAYLSDHINCSLLIGRNVISDEAFDAQLLPNKGVEKGAGN